MATTTKTTTHRYHPSEHRYQRTKGGGRATYPKVKRVYIAGNVKEWKLGSVRKRTGREVRGVRIEYEPRRAGYRRKAYTAERSNTSYEVSPVSVGKTSQRFMQVVEVPEAARNVQFHADRSSMPERYLHALQHVR
jgi:hypothetical protein